MKKSLKTISLVLTSIILYSCSSNVAGTNVNQPTTDQASAQNNLKVIKNINVGKTPHGMWQCQGFIYNSNVGDKTISVIDSKTDTIVKTISLPDEGVPGYIKSFHDDKNILVTDTKNSALLVIDPSQDHKIIQKISLDKKPDKIRIADDDKNVFVSVTNDSKTINLVFNEDRSKEPEIKNLKSGKMAEKSDHRDLNVSKEWLITPNVGDNDVSLVNFNTGVEKRLKDGNEPSVTNIGSINNIPSVAIVGNKASNTVTLFDFNSDNKTTLNDVGLSPTESAVIEKDNTIFITMSGSDEVVAIDYNTKKVIDKIKTKSRPVHIYSVKTKSGADELWVGNDRGASVTVINPKTLKVKAHIDTGNGHHKMAFTDTKAYISNITDNTITVINRGE